MASVVTTSTDIGVLQTWDAPGKEDVGLPAVPGGEIQFSGFEAIDAIGAADTGTWILSLTLPRNYIYVVSHINISSQSAADLVVYERGMVLHTIPTPLPASGSLDQVILYQNRQGVANIIASAVPAIINQFSCIRTEWPSSIIRVLDAPGAITVNWHAPGQEFAVTTFWNVRVLRYTIEQWRRAAIHTPLSAFYGSP